MHILNQNSLHIKVHLISIKKILYSRKQLTDAGKRGVSSERFHKENRILSFQMHIILSVFIPF